MKTKLAYALVYFLLPITSFSSNLEPIVSDWTPQSQELLMSLKNDLRDSLALIAKEEWGQGRSLEQLYYNRKLQDTNVVKLGLILELNEQKTAFDVIAVKDGNHTQESGLTVGDEIISVDGVTVSLANEDEILEQFQALKVGQTLSVGIRRQNKTQEILLLVAGRFLPQVEIEIGYPGTAHTQDKLELTRRALEILDELSKRAQLTMALVHENEASVGNELISSFSIHMPSMNALDLGLELDISALPHAYKVLSIQPNSAAEELGLDPGDLIESVNGIVANEANRDVILETMRRLHTGDLLEFTVSKKGSVNQLSMTVEEPMLPDILLRVGKYGTTHSVKPELVQQFNDSSNSFKKTKKPRGATKISRIESSYDASVDFSKYETYGFYSPTAIDSPDFHELLGLTFTAAIEQQMRSRGYVSSQSPDILINVSMSLRDVQKAPRRPENGNCPSYRDYYSRSSGFIEVDGQTKHTFCKYTDGSVRIDMVDVKQARKIWESTSLFRIDFRERGPRLNQFIVNDIYYMFEASPFRTRKPPAIQSRNRD